MIVDCISDLHGFYPDMPGGDLLIVCGDCTSHPSTSQELSFLSWMQSQKYTKKIFIAGNHDGWLEKVKPKVLEKWDIEYLCDSGCEYRQWPNPSKMEKGKAYDAPKFKIWGMPWTPTFYNWHFMKDRGADMKAMCDLIPDDTDILITHGPPYLVGDKTQRGEHVGCHELREALDRVKPRLHVFGHIHEARGQTLYKHVGKNTICVNCSHVNLKYEPVHSHIRIEL